MRLSMMMPLAAGGAFLLTGCHTVEGVGRDIQAVGTGIAYVARDTNDQLFGGYGGSPQGTAEVGEPCDALGDELAGGSGLPPCPR
ncbi:hypothetical protein [Hyphomonas sp.]|uniref:hypothetical protein n=1 Tax=Hyphomonas sp. TaxID=87 RepID=UPI00391DFB53